MQERTNYEVPADQPKFLDVAELGISKARILSLGTYKSGRIQAPTNLFDTGWYRGSSKPGQSGAMFIYGHFSSPESHGIFYGLSNLKPGSAITATAGDNQVYTYRVVKTRLYPAESVDMGAVLAPVAPGRPGLNVMTCAGAFDTATGTFSKRLVVFASL